MRFIATLRVPAMAEKPLLDRLRPLLFLALSLSIPAFYLVMTGSTTVYRGAGRLLYLAAGVLIALDIGSRTRQANSARSSWREARPDLIICCGALASAWPTDTSWSGLEWLVRSLFCALVFLRLSMLALTWIGRRHLITTLVVSAGLLAVAGAGFYWLEPRVPTYADGLWLAFTTGATVGYGDLVPSTPASRIFAVFVVLLGYAVFSVVTASIAALFIGEDERRFQKELHADIRALHEEVAALRRELRHRKFVTDDAEPCPPQNERHGERPRR
jgi:voltage-gated potassium channel